jgi:hypothetical protein
MSALNAGKISEIIWIMGRIGFSSTNPDHSTMYNNLLHHFCDESDLSGREVTTTLGGLARMNVKWNYLAEDTRQDIKTAIGKVALSLNDREIGNILHSMTKLFIPWDEFPTTVQNNLLESFVRNSKKGKMLSHQGSMAIYSLGLLGIKIDNVTPAVRDNIFSTGIIVLEESVTNIHKSVTQQSSNVVYGFMKLGIKWSSLPSNVKECLERAILNIMGYMNEQEVANTIYSFGVMDAPWTDLSSEMQSIIENTAVQRLRNMIPQGISNTIYGMGAMNAQFSSMSKEYQSAIYDAIKICFSSRMVAGSQAVGNTLYSLGKL